MSESRNSRTRTIRLADEPRYLGGVVDCFGEDLPAQMHLNLADFLPLQQGLTREVSRWWRRVRSKR